MHLPCFISGPSELVLFDSAGILLVLQSRCQLLLLALARRRAIGERASELTPALDIAHRGITINLSANLSYWSVFHAKRCAEKNC